MQGEKTVSGKTLAVAIEYLSCHQDARAVAGVEIASVMRVDRTDRVWHVELKVIVMWGTS